MFFKRNEYEEAGKCFDEAIRHKPEFALAHFYNGITLL